MKLTPCRARLVAAMVAALPVVALGIRFVAMPGVLYGTDFDAYYRPHAVFAREAFHRDSELPRWNPFQYAGIPYLGNGQGNLHYPGNWVFLGLAPDSAFEVVVLLHLLLAAFGMYRLTRQYHRSRPACVLAAIAYSSSFPFILRIDAGHLPHLITQAQAPLLLVLVLKTVTRPTLLHAAGLAVVIAGVLTGGNPQFVAYLAVFAVSLAAWRLLEARREGASVGRPLLLLLASGAVGIALAAPALLPLLEVASSSARSTLDSELLARLTEPLHDFYPGHLLALFIPFFGWTPGSEAFLAHEKALYLGIFPLLLALSSLGKGPLRGAALFFSLGTGVPLLAALVPALLSILPGSGMFRIPERVVWLSVLSLGVLSAFGWDGGSWRKPRVLAGLGMLSAGAVALVAILHRAPEAFLALGLAAASLLVLWKASGSPQVLGLGILLTVVELGGFGQWRLRTVPSDRVEAPPWYARHIGPERAGYRLLDLKEPDARGVAQGFRLLRGCGHPVPSRLSAYAASAWKEAAPRMDTLPIGAGPADPAVLRRLNVRWIVTQGDASPAPGWRRVAQWRGESLFEDPDPGPEAFLEAANGSATLLRPGANRLDVRVRASQAGRLVVSESWAPGWTATVDGRSLPVSATAAEGLLQTEVSAGESRVVFDYVPRSWRIGGVLSVVASLLAVAAGIGGMLLRQKRQEPPPTVR